MVFFLHLQVIAENLSEEEIIGLKEMFKSLDTDNNGIVTLEELRTGLPKLGSKISEAEIRQLMEAVSLSQPANVESVFSSCKKKQK